MISKIVAFVLMSFCCVFCISSICILVYGSIKRKSWNRLLKVIDSTDIEEFEKIKNKNLNKTNLKETPKEIKKSPSALDFAYYLTSVMKMDKLKLDALLYYIQAASLVRYERKAFDDVINCGLFAPEIPSIDKYVKEKNGVVKCNYKYKKLSLIDVHLADLVMGCFGDLSSTELIAIIHSESPWQLVYNSSSFNFEISTSEMKDYYRNVFEFK